MYHKKTFAPQHALAALALTTGIAAAAEPSAVAFVQCAPCHSAVAEGPHGVGPNLAGIVGKPIAKASGFRFSRALKRHSGIWTEDALHAWLENPQRFAPGTTMAYAGLKNSDARQAVIDYLKTAR
ncbi:MAG TPA: c-type cytochrome [Rhodocyclaceae bacterium]|nr:c-type cytochrome [Rhodocyclaceae bacterium]HRQ46627.1 c-type cytochrome [Rhodocyclaceae bacterium]